MLSEFKDKQAQPALRTHPERGGQECRNRGGGREAPSWVPETHQAQGDSSWAGLPSSFTVFFQIKVQTNFIVTTVFKVRRAARPG